MIFRVPLLLQVVDAVIHRLDPAATRTFDPPGKPDSGYDDVYREPVLYESTPDDAATRTSSRKELAEIRVPCQVETQTFERLQQAFSGNVPDSLVILVTHRRDLELLALLDSTTGRPKIGIGDRVSALEQHNLPGVIARSFDAPGLFVTQVLPGSWGFGPTGFDLEMLFLTDREQGLLR